MSEFRDLLERGVRGYVPDASEGLERTHRRADRRERNRRLMAGAVAVALVSGAFAGLRPLLFGDAQTPRPGIEPGDGGVLSLDLGIPTALTTGFGSVWVGLADPGPPGQGAEAGSARVARIDPETGELLSMTEIRSGELVDISGLTSGAGAIWVVEPLIPALHRIDPRTSQITRTIDLASVAEGIVPGPIAVTAEVVRVADRLSNQVVRLDPATGDVLAVDIFGDDPVLQMQAVDSSIWTMSAHEVRRFDGAAGHSSVDRVVITDTATALAVHGDGVLVAWRNQGIRTSEFEHVFSWQPPRRVTGLEVVGDWIWATTEKRGISPGMQLWSVRLDGQNVSGPVHIGSTKVAGSPHHVADTLAAVGGWLWAVDGDSNKVLRIDTLVGATPAPLQARGCLAPSFEATYLPDGFRPEPVAGPADWEAAGRPSGTGDVPRGAGIVHYPGDAPDRFIQLSRAPRSALSLVHEPYPEPIEVLGVKATVGEALNSLGGRAVHFAIGDGRCSAYDIVGLGLSRGEITRFAEGLRAS